MTDVRYFKMHDKDERGNDGPASYWGMMPSGYRRFFKGHVYPARDSRDIDRMIKLNHIFFETSKDGNDLNPVSSLKKAVDASLTYSRLGEKPRTDTGTVPPKRVVAKDKVASSDTVPLNEMDRVQLVDLAKTLNVINPPTNMNSLRAVLRKALDGKGAPKESADKE